MNQLKWICSLITICILTIQCKKQGCFTESGPIVIKSNTIEPFKYLKLYDNINLILVEDTLERITVEAGENLQSFIETSISDQILTLKNNSTCDWLRSANERINVTLHIKNIDNIEYYGAGNITSANMLKEDNIAINAWTGAGNINLDIDAQVIHAVIHGENADIILSGKSDVANIYSTSRGTFDLRNLIVKHLDITHRSIRDAFIYVTESIDAKILYKGNIYYKGNPPVKQVQNYGEGRLIPL